MVNKKLKWHLLPIILLICLVITPVVLSKYSTTLSKKITIKTVQPEYDVVYNANAPAGVTVTGTMSNQHFVYSTAQNLYTNKYVASGYLFTGWNTKIDGSGDFYTDQQLVENLTEIDGDTVNLYAQWRDVIAEINGTYYKTLQAAVNAVPTNNTATTIKLLSNTSETITVNANKNIIFDLQNYTISNNGSSQVIVNNGTINISNGTIRSSASFGAIDNEKNGKIVMSGGQIIATGERQAIYNKGTVEISGSAYLSSSAPARGTVQNLENASLTITGGTIVSTTQQAVTNDGILTIGIEDGDVDVSAPILQGATYGITSTSEFAFYNGVAKGKTGAIDNILMASEREAGYQMVTSTETIEGSVYQTAHLGIAKIVTFNPEGGTLTETSRAIEEGKKIGTLPVPTKAGYKFDGWFTSSTGGDKIDENTIITDDVTYYAHWTEVKIAEIDGTSYNTLQAAIDAVPTNNTQTTIKLLHDTAENVTVKKNQNIVFDIQNYTIKNNTNSAVITNNGTIAISNGTITTNATTASAINNNQSGKITISGGKVIATGQRQALYNDKGYAEITGTAYLSSSITATGERGTVQNQASGTMLITGGTIVSTTNQALYNQGLLTIGIEDGDINTTSPVFRGATYGIKSTTNFSLYDGIAKGKKAAIDNESKISKKEEGTQIVHGTETIEDEEYDTAYLQ